ncbi:MULTISPECIES: hypothetical protein [unclassified Streptomyces]|uniref:hypothetical protein n=1 Tax=unclassified Streptomyces TaxID=2593676 RepID=UPI00093AB18D|nr:hypothetical protein [Streptomyces sp. TSRI0107]OKJ87686.1 hypothetical protein AMK31_11030 [Streptomyces sp. TSRI0107]
MPADPTPQDPFENRLGAALRETGDTFDTDRPALIAAGQARGRRMRLRRRAAVFGGAASLVAVGVSAALVLPGNGNGTGTAAGGGAQSVGRAGTASATTSTPAPETAEELIATLKSLLPKGKVTGERGDGTAGGSPYALVVFDDGEGPGAVSVGLNRVEPGSESARQVTECPDKAFVAHDACSTTRLADGSLLMLFQGYEYPDRRVDTKRWQAELVTAEGQHISVSEWNAEAEKDAPITREQPPLSPEELAKIAKASAWRAAIDAIPENPKGKPSAGGDVPPAADGTSVVKTLKKLLPKGLKVVSDGGQETEYGYVVVDDGKGRSMVQINVQPDMSDVADQLFGADSETLEDGTKVAVRQGPGEKGGEGVVMWNVDTMRPDGRRVVISAFNSGAQHTAATRETPALTIEQLREIALDPQWPTLL